MEILYFDRLESTQKYLIERIKSNNLSPPVAVTTRVQTAGVGSRDNRWDGGDGNLFFSFALEIQELPKDLFLGSSSIYFSYIMKEILEKFSPNIWLKWPNDLYLNDKKIGGTITKKIGEILVCGMGVNLKKGSNKFGALDIGFDKNFLLKLYFEELKTFPSWGEIFNKYSLEFQKNIKNFSTHIDEKKRILKDATLLQDGSILIDNRRIYSFR